MTTIERPTVVVKPAMTQLCHFKALVLHGKHVDASVILRSGMLFRDEDEAFECLESDPRLTVQTLKFREFLNPPIKRKHSKKIGPRGGSIWGECTDEFCA